jgi:ZIP family zinc transporter
MYSPFAAIIFLSIGAGAIFQVVFSIASMMAKDSNKNSDQNNNKENNKKQSFLSAPVISGFVIGMAIMYATSLLIPS